MRYKTTAILVFGLMAGSCAGALARPAFTTFNANLRSGPGVGSPIVGIVPDQAQIEVGSCAGSWCGVNWEGAEGYLSSTLIAFAPRHAAVARSCDPAFDARCSGYGGRYVYYNGDDDGFASDDGYAYDSFGYPNDSFGFGIFSGYQGGRYDGRRIGGQRWGAVHGATNIARPASSRGAYASRTMSVGTTGRLSGGGRFAANHMGAGRVSGGRAEMRGR